MFSGSIGVLVRACHATNIATKTTPPTNEPSTELLVQPAPLPRIKPSTIPKSPTETRPNPGRSSTADPPRPGANLVTTTGTKKIPRGTLIQKIHCQEKPWTTAPPTNGPSATANPLAAPQAANAAPRRAGGTAALKIVRVNGRTSAPPAPCTARAATSQPAVGANAAAALAKVNTDNPRANMRRRPNRSPRAAPVSRRTPKLRV
ncbi:hypothetical protein GALL_390710 [mine drainage metagenome]|uniref:Uncharacterized protein n=1 Tax=mine drainage metagenome TaxID=410659 RepID=A0A1J5Q6A1_9ZZZZ